MITEEISNTTNKNQDEKESKKKLTEKFNGKLDKNERLIEREPNIET